MCFCVTGYNKCYQLIQQCLVTTECEGFGDNSAVEFCGISQTVSWNLAKFATEKRGLR